MIAVQEAIAKVNNYSFKSPQILLFVREEITSFLIEVFQQTFSLGPWDGSRSASLSSSCIRLMGGIEVSHGVKGCRDDDQRQDLAIF
ncbi:hypothetical protein TNCV_527171 [Trichonephila clavipes]|nr:hypothetical protein TNCV_527171 [Trichonephila clavipes]